MAQATPWNSYQGRGHLWQLPIPKGCRHGKTQNTEVWGIPVQMQKCQHSKPARKGGGQEGVEKARTPKMTKKKSTKQAAALQASMISPYS